LAFVGQIGESNTNIYVLDLMTGIVTTELPIHAYYPLSDARWSPDDTKISFSGFNPLQPNIGIWILDGISNTETVSATFGTAAWSPDGSKLAVTGYIDGKDEIRIIDLTTKKSESIYTLLTTNSQDTISGADWSPDGSTLAFIMTERISDEDVQHLYRIDVNGSNLHVFTNTPTGQFINYFKWILQGKWIAFVAGKGSIYSKLSFIRADDQCMISPLTELNNNDVLDMDISRDGTIAVVRVGVNLYKLDINAMLAPKSLEGALTCP